MNRPPNLTIWWSVFEFPESGCRHILELFYVDNPGLCLHSTGLIRLS